MGIARPGSARVRPDGLVVACPAPNPGRELCAGGRGGSVAGTLRSPERGSPGRCAVRDVTREVPPGMVAQRY